MTNSFLGNCDGFGKFENLIESILQMPLHNDCCNGVSFHPYRPILATAAGQHHTLDPLDQTRIDMIYENYLSLWWIGQQQDDPHLLNLLSKAANDETAN